MDKKIYNPTETIFLTLTPILAIVGFFTYIYFYDITWKEITLFITFYFATGLSITAGYHRCFSHKAYTSNSFLKIFYAFFGAAAYENSILKWANDHRKHHRYVDREEDPYNIKKGFWHSHIGWILYKCPEHKFEPEKWCRDLLKDKIVMFQHRHFYKIANFSSFALPTIIGFFMGIPWGGLLFGGIIRVVVVHHVTFLINSWAHYYGKQPYSSKHTAKDNPILALFTYGEGFHNFHHEFGTDYRNGIKWYHYDPTKWFIKLASYINFSTNLKVTPQEEIIRAKIERQMEILRDKNIKIKNEYILEKAEILKVKLEDIYKRLTDLRDEYNKKIRFGSCPKELKSLKISLQTLSKNLKINYRSWTKINKLLIKVA